jgi:hypothetical protein
MVLEEGFQKHSHAISIPLNKDIFFFPCDLEAVGGEHTMLIFMNVLCTLIEQLKYLNDISRCRIRIFNAIRLLPEALCQDGA